jgi:hypothetical protein
MAVTVGATLLGGIAGLSAAATIGTATLGSLALITIGAVGQGYLAYQNQRQVEELQSKVAGLSTGGYTVNQKGSALHHQVVYGKTKIGGVIVFDHAHGTDNKYLSRIVAYAAHEIDAFEDIYIDNYKVTSLGSDGNVAEVREVDENGNVIGSADTRFSGFIKIRKVLGGHTTSLNGQSLSIDGVSFGGGKWTANHKLQGIAHLAVMFKFDRPEEEGDINRYQNGLPSVTAIVRGKKVYDPRTATTAWSDNPALIIRDYLTNSDYGLGESATNIDDTKVSTAANICDETVSTDSSTRYTCNGAWLTSQTPIDLLTQLTGTCAGTLWYAQGQWRMLAGKYVAPTVTLTEDDLRSPLSVSTRHSRRDNFNGVRGVFKGPASNYQMTDYPLVSSQTFIDVDGGLESVLDLPLPFTDTPGEAQRLANIALERNRSQLTLTGAFGLQAFALQVGDIVNITNTRLGFSNKIFEVVQWSFGIVDGGDLQTNLTLRETTTTTYDEYQDVAFESDNTTLPGVLGPTVIAGSGDVNSTTNVTGLTASGGVREIYVNWTNPINNDFSYTKIYYDTNSTISGASQQNITGESFVLSGLSANDQRYFWAQAYDTSNNTLGSLVGPVNATVKDITTGDIEDDAVTEAKIAADAVTNTQIASQAVQTGSIFPAAVVTDKIGDNAVSELVAVDFSATSVPSAVSNAVFSTTISNNKACDIVLEANFEITGTPTSGDILLCSASVDGETTAPGYNEIWGYSDGAVGDRTVIVFKGSVGASNFNVEGKVRRSSSSSSTAYNAECYLVVHRLFK